MRTAISPRLAISTLLEHRPRKLSQSPHDRRRSAGAQCRPRTIMPGADGGVGRLVDQDEAAGAAVARCTGRTRAARWCAGARGRCRSAPARSAARCARSVCVSSMSSIPSTIAVTRPRGVLEHVAAAGAQQVARHPADVRLELARDLGRLVGAADQLAARDVELVLEAQRQRHRRGRLLELAVEGVDRRDPGAPAARAATATSSPRRSAPLASWPA